MKYTLLGDPIPLARARFGRGVVYNTQAPIQNRCRLDLMKQHKQQPLLQGALHLTVYFYMPMPSSWTQVKREKMVGKPHITKPDWSNMLKFVEDCGNGIIYKDDAIICSVSGNKIYDWYPRTEFSLDTWDSTSHDCDCGRDL